MKYMRKAGLVVAKVHENLRKECAAGLTTADLDEVSACTIASIELNLTFLDIMVS